MLYHLLGGYKNLMLVWAWNRCLLGCNGHQIDEILIYERFDTMLYSSNPLSVCAYNRPL